MKPALVIGYDCENYPWVVSLPWPLLYFDGLMEIFASNLVVGWYDNVFLGGLFFFLLL